MTDGTTGSSLGSPSLGSPSLGSPSLGSCDLMGVRVQTFTMDRLHDTIVQAVRARRRIVLAHHNLHSVYLFHHDAKVRTFYEGADGIWVDGMPLILWGRILGLPLRRDNRFTMSHWMPDFMAHAARERLRVFYLGSAPGVARRGLERFRRRFPALEAACHHGFFDNRPDSPENRAVIDAINGFRPHILLVGMGVPRQEHWIVDNLSRLEANAVLNVGAAIEYHAGVQRRPPAVLGRLGLEWLFRLSTDPRRLAGRYLVEPLRLVPVLARDLRSRGSRTSHLS